VDDYDQVPPPGKGSLYIRPLLMGSGQILGLGAAPEYTLLVYVSPVGNYFKVRRVLILEN
jgi:branched-chain amino acid aminotransferase